MLNLWLRFRAARVNIVAGLGGLAAAVDGRVTVVTLFPQEILGLLCQALVLEFLLLLWTLSDCVVCPAHFLGLCIEVAGVVVLEGVELLGGGHFHRGHLEGAHFVKVLLEHKIHLDVTEEPANRLF